jgi:hypothetical protein
MEDTNYFKHLFVQHLEKHGETLPANLAWEYGLGYSTSLLVIADLIKEGKIRRNKTLDGRVTLLIGRDAVLDTLVEC